MRHYERRLPHWDAVGQRMFVTCHLHGSLRQARVFPPEQLTTSGQAFRAMDRLLDAGGSGQLFLGRAEIASMVEGALLDGERRFHRYDLHAYVVMPNHVHMLVTPTVAATHWLGPLKGFTSHAANILLGSQGTAFWQDESYDHLVRSDAEFERIRRYIEENPVKAGLAAEAGEFRWSSAWRGGPAESRLQPGLAAPR